MRVVDLGGVNFRKRSCNRLTVAMALQLSQRGPQQVLCQNQVRYFFQTRFRKHLPFTARIFVGV